MEKRELVINALKEKDFSELRWIHRDYLDAQNMMGDEIFDNDDDFFQTFFEGKTIEAVRAVCYGDYRYTDEYVWFNGYGNLESGSEWEAINRIDFDDLADWIIENDKMEEYEIEIDDDEIEESEETEE